MVEYVFVDVVKQFWLEIEVDVGCVDYSEKFQYDFCFLCVFILEDFEVIEKKMCQIIKQNYGVEWFEVDWVEVECIFIDMGEMFKIECFVDIFEGDMIMFFKYGGFVDFC